MKKKIVIIGGGFYGMYISEYLALQGNEVILFEKGNDFMLRASHKNQARVHNGYHYPRSVLTALRSRMSFSQFNKEFENCIDNSFSSYYMVAKNLSKISSQQFEKFCNYVGAHVAKASSNITRFVDYRLIEEVFETTEYVFNSFKLKEEMIRRIDIAGVNYYLNTEVVRIEKQKKRIMLEIRNTSNRGIQEPIIVDHVFNCTYSSINQVVQASKFELIPLKHELTEMCLMKVPEELEHTSITVMDGPFFSLMPFPSKNLHSFSHVRYTPHYEWYETNETSNVDHIKHLDFTNRKSAWKKMVQDAKRYIPILAECIYEESNWEIKTVLPKSEIDDSRPILFKPNFGMDGFHCVMGGKIDNVYDIIEVISKSGLVNG